MDKVKLNRDNEVLLRTTLTKNQVGKFNSLVSEIVINNGIAYVPSSELHGVLLTTSKQRAREIINAHKDILRIYLVSAKDLGISADYSYVRPVGLQVLLDHLAVSNPKRATAYRASAALLAYIVAAYPQLSVEADIQAQERARIRQAVFGQLKRKHDRCQLSGIVFGGGIQQHVHHIIAESVRPDLDADEGNLVVIAESVHKDYHAWLAETKKEVSKETLKNFARTRSYSLEWAYKQANA